MGRHSEKLDTSRVRGKGWSLPPPELDEPFGPGQTMRELFYLRALVRSLLLAACLLASPANAQVSWETAIEAVREKGYKYYDYALSLGSGHPGSALHGIGHDRHICAIVGRMLGLVDEIRQAETFDDPPLSPDADAFMLMQHSLFLDAWVAAAERAVSMSDSQKKSLWNLECVGKHGIPMAAFLSEPGLSADFSVRDNTLLVYGDIDSGFHDRFVSALNANPGVSWVALGSAGGSVADALLAGVEIRRRGLGTTLHGPCFSACPLVFVGGKDRIIWMGPGPHLGFHQVYTSSGAVSLSDEVYGKIALYLEAMGVDAQVVLHWMASSGPDEIYEPDIGALCRPGIATWVQRMCGH